MNKVSLYVVASALALFALATSIYAGSGYTGTRCTWVLEPNETCDLSFPTAAGRANELGPHGGIGKCGTYGPLALFCGPGVDVATKVGE